jgi:hypothetical protein
VGKPTSHRPNKRALQKALPNKGAAPPAKGGGLPNGPEKTVNWPTPDRLGNSSKRLNGVERVKTRMWERG